MDKPQTGSPTPPRRRTKTKQFRQGKYTLTNPDKYLGDKDKVFYRSSWELRCFQFFDNNANVLKWASEEIPIKYIKPTDKKIHTYWPDLFVIYADRSGIIKKELIEIKPDKQTKEPKKNATLYAKLDYAVNISKWKAAASWCESKGIKFRLLTEKQLYL